MKNFRDLNELLEAFDDCYNGNWEDAEQRLEENGWFRSDIVNQFYNMDDEEFLIFTQGSKFECFRTLAQLELNF